MYMLNGVTLTQEVVLIAQQLFSANSSQTRSETAASASGASLPRSQQTVTET